MFKLCGNAERKHAGQDSVLHANFQLPGYWAVLGVDWALDAWLSKQAKPWNKKNPPATDSVIRLMHFYMWTWDAATTELTVYGTGPLSLMNPLIIVCSKTTLKYYGLFDINMAVWPCSTCPAVPRCWDTRRYLQAGEATSANRYIGVSTVVACKPFSGLWLMVIKASCLFINLFWIWKAEWSRTFPFHITSLLWEDLFDDKHGNTLQHIWYPLKDVFTL